MITSSEIIFGTYISYADIIGSEFLPEIYIYYLASHGKKYLNYYSSDLSCPDDLVNTLIDTFEWGERIDALDLFYMFDMDGVYMGYHINKLVRYKSPDDVKKEIWKQLELFNIPSNTIEYIEIPP